MPLPLLARLRLLPTPLLLRATPLLLTLLRLLPTPLPRLLTLPLLRLTLLPPPTPAPPVTPLMPPRKLPTLLKTQLTPLSRLLPRLKRRSNRHGDSVATPLLGCTEKAVGKPTALSCPLDTGRVLMRR